MSVNAGVSPSRTSLTIFDVVAIFCSAVGFLWAGAAVLWIQPTFIRMLAEFNAELPWFTQLSLRPWFPLLMASLAPSFAVSRMLFHMQERWRTFLVVAAIVSTLLAPALFLIAMYLPIFTMANKIQ